MNHHRALALCLSMIFSENRFTLFRIMLYFPRGSVTGTCGEVLTTRGLPSGLRGWPLSRVSRYKKNFSASMGVALVVYSRTSRALAGQFNQQNAMRAGTAMLRRVCVDVQSVRLPAIRAARACRSRDLPGRPKRLVGLAGAALGNQPALRGHAAGRRVELLG
ncbi:hypothetical protein [Bradyrhizobium sp. CCBAU 51753]|uniref:hypothetical protein n=1 Tax=Bradyrhizobium sp. CCBAU 51753 TaxID=1325100 RepID=UPI00188C3844|nr:hypothetical protein [Bradyrhizobium sp. CCBAU 51753]